VYYYEKDYIMRLIHGIAQVLAYLYFGRKMEEEEELASVMGQSCKENNDYFRRMVDRGEINAAEDRLFDLLETAGFDNRQKAALAISFYDYVNSKDDDFLSRANFSRDEIISGMEDALQELNMSIPEYLRIR